MPLLCQIQVGLLGSPLGGDGDLSCAADQSGHLLPSRGLHAEGALLSVLLVGKTTWNESNGRGLHSAKTWLSATPVTGNGTGCESCKLHPQFYVAESACPLICKVQQPLRLWPFPVLPSFRAAEADNNWGGSNRFAPVFPPWKEFSKLTGSPTL